LRIAPLSPDTAAGAGTNFPGDCATLTSILTGTTEDAVRAERKKLGLVPSYRLVDTCAAEFEAYTPYYYSTYDRGDDEVRPSDRRKIMILGGGPNRIGQGIEFDYCCVHASFALKEAGFETIMVNSNPETVSTDYDTSDRLYFEPLTLEDVLHIYEREKCWGAIAQFGGQTPLNLRYGHDLRQNHGDIGFNTAEAGDAVPNRGFGHLANPAATRRSFSSNCGPSYGLSADGENRIRIVAPVPPAVGPRAPACHAARTE